ncbi:MAG: DUF4142 domain-containing protein [Elusimicrobia bacterium]|nr:DUF4142 domain-containing protein [Elusimicrobiota bacterium]
MKAVSLALLLAASVTYAAQSQMGPEQVLAKVHEINASEIRLGEMARSKGQSDQVKEFGEMLVEEHRKAEEKVMEFARQNSLAVGQASPDPKQKQTFDRLKGLRGRQFDSEFVRVMHEEHMKAIQMLRDAQGNPENERITGLIADILPALEKHHERAMEIQQALRR